MGRAARQHECALVVAVAAEDVLPVVHHADFNVEQANAHGFDPADYVSPSESLPSLVMIGRARSRRDDLARCLRAPGHTTATMSYRVLGVSNSGRTA